VAREPIAQGKLLVAMESTKPGLRRWVERAVDSRAAVVASHRTLQVREQRG
jgi:hypothetical protein